MRTAWNFDFPAPARNPSAFPVGNTSDLQSTPRWGGPISRLLCQQWERCSKQRRPIPQKIHEGTAALGCLAAQLYRAAAQRLKNNGFSPVCPHISSTNWLAPSGFLKSTASFVNLLPVTEPSLRAGLFAVTLRLRSRLWSRYRVERTRPNCLRVPGRCCLRRMPVAAGTRRKSNIGKIVSVVASVVPGR
jgi:hypothetical protein